MFGIILIYQILLHLFGGSWSIEEIVLVIVSINMAMTFGTGWQIAGIKKELQYLRRDFDRSDRAFRNHLQHYHDYKI